MIKDKRQWLIFNCETRENSEIELLKAPTPEGQEPERVYDESPVHSRDYSTTLNGKLITLNFVSPVKTYPQVEKVFDRSIESIQVKY